MQPQFELQIGVLNIKTNENISNFLKSASILESVEGIYPLHKGGNNKTWKIKCSEHEYVLKEYFRHANDQRNRLEADFQFTSYAYGLTPESVPRPLVSDKALGMALYDFVEGKEFSVGSIGENEIKAAASFFKAINPPSRHQIAQHIQNASEASFSVDAHLKSITDRLKNLSEAIYKNSALKVEQDFMADLMLYWKQLCSQVVRDCAELRIDMMQVLLPLQRCLSPSDFGFHNALKLDDDGICFLDFEYSGWDDPAKMIGDFFAQLAVPVPQQYFEQFCNLSLTDFIDIELQLKRAKILRFVYQIKWCCIAMNVFLPVHLERRLFANPKLSKQSIQDEQFYKAQQIFQLLKQANHELY